MENYQNIVKGVGLTLGLLCVPLSGATFEDLADTGTSAKMAGIGYIQGFDNSAASLFENPAALYRVERTSIAGFYTSFFLGESKYLNIAGAHRLPFGGVLSVGMMQSKVSDIEHTEGTAGDLESFQVKSYFDSARTMYKLGYQTDILEGGIHVGGAINYYKHDILNVEGSGYNIDLGAITDVRDITVSLIAKNAMPGQTVKYNNDSEEDLAPQYIASGRYSLRSIDVYGQAKATDGNTLLSAGATYYPSYVLNFSAGVSEFMAAEKKSRKATLGMNVQVVNIGLSVAFEKSEDFTKDNQLYLSTQFDF